MTFKTKYIHIDLLNKKLQKDARYEEYLTS